MAEIDVGKHCSVSSCKQLDFLPFICADCSAIFCLEHRSTTSHNCEGKNDKEVKLPQEQESKPRRQPPNEKSTCFECFFEGCDVRGLMPVKCEHCEHEFCLRHRHQPDHSCPKLEEDKLSTKEASSKKRAQIEKKEKTGRGGARSSSRAAKVALMKMKLHAVGESSTPQEERVYFSIILPEESTERSKSMFFSKKWSTGRIIDEIAKMCNLRNENNRQSSKKLRLFERSPKRELTIGKTLETEMMENSGTLFSGSELILEYVEADV